MDIQPERLLKLIDFETRDKAICPITIMAICKIESALDVHAIRAEKSNPWLYRCDYYAKKNNITQHTEETLQHCSYGLMQIMGSTARSPLNFHGNLLRLVDPQINIHYGVKYYAWLKRRYTSATQEDIISAYNGGHPMRRRGKEGYVNQNYVDGWEKARDSVKDKFFS